MSNVYDKVLRWGMYGLSTESLVPAGGNVWYVDGNSGNAANTASSGQGESWDLPFANINYAISRCSNGANDVILVAPDHTETIEDTNDSNVSGTTTDEFCIDKSDITIVGIGENTRRPTITLSGATDACIDVRAANVTLCNLIFYNNIANNVAMMDVQADAGGLVVENCRFYEASSTAEAILQINITADADDITIRGCDFNNALTNDGGLACIKLEGGSDRIRIIDNKFYGDWNEQMIDADAAASLEVEVVGNRATNVDTGVANCLDFHGSTTGIVADNFFRVPAGGSGGGAIVAAGCSLNNNKVAVLAGQEGDVDTGSVGGTAIGNHWYVDSGTGATTGSGKSWADALSLIDDAIGKCTASNGDVIHVAAGHAETDMDGTAGQIFDVDVAGISIIGEGQGDTRPTFTFTTDTTNAVCYITGADVLLENLIFACGVNSQNHLIDVAADDVTIRNCEFIESGATALSCITADSADGAADNLVIDHCRFYTPTAGNQDNAIEIGKDMAGIRITNNYIMGNFDEAAIEIPVAGNACQDMVISDNIIINEQTGIHCIEVEQTALTVTGICANNILVNDTRGAALQPNLLNCHNNIWAPLGGNVRPVVLEGELTTPGNNIYVDSGHAQAVDDTAHGGSWDFPLATIEYANTNCMTANNGDTIHVAPGHEETITDSVYLDFDTAGVTVIGYGNGEDAPMVTFDHASAVVDVGASNVHLKNLRFRPSTDAVAVGVDILDTFDGTTIEDCVFGYPEAATDEFAIALQIGNAGNYTTIKNCKFEMGGNASVNCINMTQANAFLEISGCTFSGACSGPHIKGTAAAITDCHIHHNTIMCTGNQDTFNLIAASTGLVNDNRIVMTAASAAAALDIGNCWSMMNYLIADDDVTGAKGGLLDTGFVSVTATADD